MMKKEFNRNSLLRKADIERKRTSFIYTCFSFSVLFFIFLLFLLPQNLSASVAQTQPTQDIIYISDGAVMSGVENISIAKVVQIEDVQNKITVKLPSKKVKAPPTIKEQIKAKEKLAVIKVVAPKYVITRTESKDNFARSTNYNTENSVVNSNFYVSRVVAHHYTVLEIKVFSYLLKTYTADFSKTATLSHSLFSRPPPAPGV